MVVMRGALLVLVAFVVAVAAACATERPPAESRGGASSGVVEGGSARDLCETRCARNIRCARATRCDCGSPQAGDTALLRADWTRAAIACLGRTSCDVDEDCENEAYRAIGVSPLTSPPVVMRCLERGAACGGSSVACRRLAAMNDEARGEAARCFEEPCEGYAACFKAFVETRVAPGMPGWR